MKVFTSLWLFARKSALSTTKVPPPLVVEGKRLCLGTTRLSHFYRGCGSSTHRPITTNRLKSPHSLKKLPARYVSSAPLDRTLPIYETVGEETIVHSPYKDRHIPKISFAEFMFSKLDEHKNRTSLVFNPTKRSYSAAELKDLSIKVASGMTKLGLTKGKRILLFANNCVEYTILFLACAATGVVLSTANPVYTPGELARQLKHSESVAVVSIPHMLETVKAALDSDPELKDDIKLIISIGEAEGCFPFTKLLEDDGKAFPENVDFNPETDVLTLPYSSGTTGLPKGVELTHYNVVSNVMQLTSGPMRFNPDIEVLLAFLPFYHIYGMVADQFAAVYLGTKLVIMPKFEPETFLSCIATHKVTYIHTVPPVTLFLAKDPLVDNYNISSLKTIVSAAAPLGRQLSDTVKERLKINIVQAYGLTESSPVTHYDTVPAKSGSIGRLVPNTQAKVVDLETGKSMGPNEPGEILVRGPQIMKGYLKNETATQDTVKGGWLHTGDIGYYDNEGYFIVSDRLKELIKYKGYQLRLYSEEQREEKGEIRQGKSIEKNRKVAPAELEAVILSHPSVQDVAVIGVTETEGHGELPKAFVVPKQQDTITEEEIAEFVKGQVAPYKWLRGGVQFVESIPKTTSGKILRRQLKQ